jgi:hypothetical protein
MLGGKHGARTIGTREDVEALVNRKPGMTAPDIARALFGPKGFQQQVNPSLLGLSRGGRIDRRGYGGSGDPYTYYPMAWRNAGTTGP